MALPDIKEVESYIREVATNMGVNPDIAVRVARSEGLAPGVWQSNFVKNGVREPSYGPFQLYEGGGLGNKFKALYGKSASDPSTWKQQVEFALSEAKKGGWSPWYGSKAVGIGAFEGIRKGAASPGKQTSGPNRGLVQPEEYDYSPSQGPGDSVAQEPKSFLSKVADNASDFGDAFSAMNQGNQQVQAAPIGPTTGYAPMQLPTTQYLAKAQQDPMSLLRKLGLI